VSWDIFLQDLPKDASQVEEIPEDFVSQPLGARTEIIEKILRIEPRTDFSKPAWCRINLPSCQMEISLGESEQVKTIALHVHGGELAAGVVAAIVDAVGCRALDAGSSSGFFDRDAAQQSYNRWRTYRDQLVDG